MKIQLIRTCTLVHKQLLYAAPQPYERYSEVYDCKFENQTYGGILLLENACLRQCSLLPQFTTVR